MKNVVHLYCTAIKLIVERVEGVRIIIIRIFTLNVTSKLNKKTVFLLLLLLLRIFTQNCIKLNSFVCTKM